MRIKNNINSIMQGNNISTKKLTREACLSEQTIRNARRNVYANLRMDTLQEFAAGLGCDFFDLIEYSSDEEVPLHYYNLNNAIFDAENISTLNNIFLERGLDFDTIPYSYNRNINIYSYDNTYTLVNIIIRNHGNNLNFPSTFEITDFDVLVNKYFIDESALKKELIELIEQFAFKNDIKQIIFNSENDNSEDSIIIDNYWYSDPNVEEGILTEKGYAVDYKFLDFSSTPNIWRKSFKEV